MPRNLDNRVEVVTPVEEPALRERIQQALETVLADNRGSWELRSDGTWTRRRRRGRAAARGAGRAHGARARAAEEPEADTEAEAEPSGASRAPERPRVVSHGAQDAVGSTSARTPFVSSSARPRARGSAFIHGASRWRGWGARSPTTGALGKRKIKQVAELVAEFVDEAAALDAADIRAIATSAAREAENGQEMADKVAA